jgi:Luciferase-like monooxygenase
VDLTFYGRYRSEPRIFVRLGRIPRSRDKGEGLDSILEIPDEVGDWPEIVVLVLIEVRKSSAAAAAVTSRIKLATGICLLPERDPIVTAKAVASLDVLSHGRAILGVGGGALKEETEIMGTRFGMRLKRLRENVEAMKELWTKEEARYEGELVRFPPIRSYPKPIRNPIHRFCSELTDLRLWHELPNIATVGCRSGSHRMMPDK